jgi:transposase-like protein
VTDNLVQPFGPLDASTEAALRASIGKFGVLIPILVDQNGRLLDGHHRKRIADGLGVECPTRVREVGSDEDAEEIARTVNLNRRHLTPEQRREVVAHLTAEGHSQRAIAKATNVSRAQIRDDQIQVGTPAHLNGKTPKKVVGTDGKRYPAKRAVAVPAAPDPVPVVDPPTVPEQAAAAPSSAVAGKPLWKDLIGDALADRIALVSDNPAAFCLNAIEDATVQAERVKAMREATGKTQSRCPHKRTTPNNRCMDCGLPQSQW